MLEKELKGKISDNKPSPDDGRGGIERMGPISLKRYIKGLEEKGMTGTECYSYAKECLQKEEAKRKEKKEEKKRKAADKEKRRKRLTQIGNDRIRTLIYDEYMSLYSAHLSRLKEESRVDKLERIRKALLNIDFVSGEINSDYYWGRFKEIVYLTDKNVLVFDGIEHDAYIYLPCQKKTKLSVISHESMRAYWFDFLQEIYRSNLRSIRRAFWTPTLELFPPEFQIRIFYRYYLNYEERPSSGRETTNIPSFTMEPV